MNKLKIITFLVPAVAMMLLCSCGKKTDDTQQITVEIPADADTASEAYRLGASHADELISTCDDNDSRHDYILEVRARMTNIETRIDAETAADYSAGFRDRLKERGDTLATVLF